LRGFPSRGVPAKFWADSLSHGLILQDIYHVELLGQISERSSSIVSLIKSLRIEYKEVTLDF
jgi:hypothetical protein